MSKIRHETAYGPSSSADSPPVPLTAVSLSRLILDDLLICLYLVCNDKSYTPRRQILPPLRLLSVCCVLTQISFSFGQYSSVKCDRSLGFRTSIRTSNQEIVEHQNSVKPRILVPKLPHFTLLREIKRILCLASGPVKRITVSKMVAEFPILLSSS